MWVEIELFEAKRLRNLTFLIDVCGIKKLFTCIVLKDIARILIEHITFFVYGMAGLDYFISQAVPEDNDLAFFISVQLT